MNTPRTKEIRRFDKARHPKNRDLPDPGLFQHGVNDEKILLLLGRMIASWPHQMIYIFAILTQTKEGSAREIFRSVIAQETKISMMRFLLEETEAHVEAPPFFDRALDEFQSLNRMRNKYVHGLWFHDDNATYLSSSDPARHPFETVTRKVQDSELTDFLVRCNKLSDAVFEYRMVNEGAFVMTPPERIERLFQGIF